ncbi:MAG: MTH865 family protein [Halolamina sp.]|uniref:MTH865 family protein n=1 Tax=Halolamina sp. TaxID=1940283 RepID=UPI002FC3DBE9
MASEEERKELREQLVTAFKGADFPVDSQMDLVPALPGGPSTRFEAGDISFTAMELAAKLGGEQEFPYSDVEQLVDDVMKGLESQDML